MAFIAGARPGRIQGLGTLSRAPSIWATVGRHPRYINMEPDEQKAAGSGTPTRVSSTVPLLDLEFFFLI